MPPTIKLLNAISRFPLCSKDMRGSIRFASHFFLSFCVEWGGGKKMLSLTVGRKNQRCESLVRNYQCIMLFHVFWHICCVVVMNYHLLENFFDKIFGFQGAENASLESFSNIGSLWLHRRRNFHVWSYSPSRACPWKQEIQQKFILKVEV